MNKYEVNVTQEGEGYKGVLLNGGEEIGMIEGGFGDVMDVVRDWGKKYPVTISFDSVSSRAVIGLYTLVTA